MNKVEFLIIHTEAAPVVTEQHRFQTVNDYHKSLDFPKSSMGSFVGYHYFCERDGMEIQARLDTDEGAHVKGMNFNSLAYGLAGNGDLKPITFAQEIKLKIWINEKMKKYGVPREKIKGHRSFTTLKTCPGKFILDEYIQSLIEKPQIPKPPETPSWFRSFLLSLVSFLQNYLLKLGGFFRR